MHENSSKINVAIVGAQGYAGQVLARLLLNHPHAQLIAVFSRDEQWQLKDDLPETAAHKVPCYPLEQLAHIAEKCQAIFLATPADVSMEIALELAGKSVQVIDLSGAFRLTQTDFESWYHEKHHAPQLLAEAHYGLAPWRPINTTTPPQLIANPGCYPTAALMALLPLLKQQIIAADDIIIDAKSGITGAGRSAKKSLLFSELSENFYPYKVGVHQHTPEITHYLNEHSAQPVNLHLTTHLLPIRRGISMSIYPQINTNMAHLSHDELTQHIAAAYANAYENYPLARVGNLATCSAAENLQLTALSKVVGSCRVHIAYRLIGKRLVIFSAIDNLLKGAASQAIENFNQLNGLAVDTGLTHVEGLL